MLSKASGNKLIHGKTTKDQENGRKEDNSGVSEHIKKIGSEVWDQ